ncbi:MAG: ABC transporter ATP-binding protein, partial [Mycoplasmataceae bacterium]|nr:ABC transporter ATP-binding protein [Mycoplasmataceae bacterium]
MKNKAIKTNYKDSWLFFLKYYTKNIKNTIIIIIISILISCMTISLPFLTQLITSAALDNDFDSIIYFAIFLILVSLIKILLNFLSDYLSEVFSTKIEIQIREEMMEKFHKLSMQTFDNTPIGIFFSRILNDLKEVRLYVYVLVNNVITIMCLIIGGFSYIFFINWIAGIIVISIYFITLIIYIIYKNNLVYHQQLNKFLNTFIDVGVGEHVQMISEIKSYNNSLTSIDKIKLLQDTYYKSIKKYSLKNALLKLVGTSSSIMISALTLIICSILYTYNAITLPQMMGLVIASNILTTPIQLTALTIMDTIKLNATIVRINEFHNWNVEENNGIIETSFKG